MTVVIEDQFTDSGGDPAAGTDIAGRTPFPTNTPGNTWVQSAVNAIESDGIGQMRAGGNNTTAQIDAGISNDEMSAQVSFDRNGADNRASVQILCDGTFGGGSGTIANDAIQLNHRDTDIKVFQVINGGSTELSTDNQSQLPNTTTWRYRIELDSNSDIRAYRDDGAGGALTEITALAVIGYSVPATLTGNQFASLAHAKYVSTGGRWDDFIVDDLQGAPPVGGSSRRFYGAHIGGQI